MFLDKTNRKKVYQKSQSIADIEALKDNENPILKNARVRRLNETNKR